jgi:hypothetical protein
MKVLYSTKIFLAYIAYKLGLIKFLIKKNSNIISYHNVIEDKYFDGALHLGVSHSLSTFKEHLKILEDFYNQNNNLSELVITFDDGYRNNYKTIKNLVAGKPYKVIFFISPSRRLNDSPFWVDKLLFACSYLNPGSYDIFSKTFLLKDNELSSRLLFYNDIYGLVLKNYDKKDEIIEPVYKEAISNNEICNFDSKYFDLRFNFMNESEIFDLSKYDNINIGYHTKNHDNLKVLDIQCFIDELKSEFFFIDKYKVIDFAYPFGGKNEINIDIVNDLIRFGFQNIYSNIPYEVAGGIIPRNSIPNEKNKYLILAYYSNLFSYAKNLISFKK